MGSITKAGNNAARRTLVEAAQHAYLAPKVSEGLRRRQNGQPREAIQIAWKAQQRLYRRHQALSKRFKMKQIIVTALARELGCFVWAIARALQQPAQTAAPSIKANGKRDYQLKPNQKYQKNGKKLLKVSA